MQRILKAGIWSCLLIPFLASSLSADAVQVFEINPNEGFPPNATTEFDILVEPDPNCRFIEDIDVGLQIPHTWQGDLK